MRPIPVAFHVWFLELHTYGIGLALTFWFGLRYAERRIRKAGYPWQWVTGMFVWVIVAAIVGARVLHVVSNLSSYTHDPLGVFAIWQGGLSSFGGILFAVPVAIFSSRRRCPELKTMRFADLLAPVLMACWGLGRLLGPQLMVAGGGHPTHQWFGMYYAGQQGKRLPVPIFQSMEDFTIFAILLLVERWLKTRRPAPAMAMVAASGEEVLPAAEEGDGETVMTDGIDVHAVAGAGTTTTETLAATDTLEETETEEGDAVPATQPPAGIVLGVGMVLWGIERYFDEHLWLGEDGHLGSLLVQGAGIALAIVGVVLLAFKVGPLRRWLRGGGGDPVRPPIELAPAGSGESGSPSPEEDAISAADEPTPPHGIAIPAAATVPVSPSGD
jgi:phosphatidylglycerol---prolipoprotein diacylglyceryl transferase